MVVRLLDKIFFAIGAIVFLQLPHFIDQYTQRMGGYAASQKAQLADYQSIANQHTQGDLEGYIERVKNNNDPAIQATAEQITGLIADNQSIEKELMVYENQPLWYQLPYFVGHIRMDLARGTLRTFTPGIPINLWAWGYGLLGGLLFSLIFHGIRKTPHTVRRLRRANPGH